MRISDKIKIQLHFREAERYSASALYIDNATVDRLFAHLIFTSALSITSPSQFQTLSLEPWTAFISFSDCSVDWARNVNSLAR